MRGLSALRIAKLGKIPRATLASAARNFSYRRVGSSEKPNPSNASLFTTTRWSVVLAAGARKSADSEGALAWLCEHYWFPLYAYARTLGNQPPEAEDLVQGFFVRILERDFFGKLTVERGRFRAYLMACFHHFTIEEWAKTKAQRRGGSTMTITLEEAAAENRYKSDFTAPGTPEQDFDRAWALTVLDHVFSRLREECDADGKEGRFAVIKPFLHFEREGRSYDEAAAELGVTTTALRVTVFRLRQRFREILVEEITQTVEDPAQVSEEIRELFIALGN